MASVQEMLIFLNSKKAIFKEILPQLLVMNEGLSGYSLQTPVLRVITFLKKLDCEQLHKFLTCPLYKNTADMVERREIFELKKEIKSDYINFQAEMAVFKQKLEFDLSCPHGQERTFKPSKVSKDELRVKKARAFGAYEKAIADSRQPGFFDPVDQY